MDTNKQPLPKAEERQALCELMHMAFVELRYLIGKQGHMVARAAAERTRSERIQKPVPQIVQVYRPTKGGNVPKREVDAANDIQKATGIKPTMVPVRPLPEKKEPQ